MEPLLNIAISAARQAGDIIIRYRDQLDRLKVKAKGEKDFCSEVDLMAEQVIIHTLKKAYPSYGVLGEESGLHEGDEDFLWIIDPLDGTSNYLHGFPFFCVSIALQVKGRIEQAVIYDPLRHECFIASKGRGARLNDRRIRVSKQTQLDQALLSTGVPFRNKLTAQRYLPTLEVLAGKCGGVRRTGSAALDLAYVASGRLDGFWEPGLRVWDIAAGSLLIREAGGLISDTKGGDDFIKQGDVIAGTPKVFKALLQTLSPILSENS